jgi:thioredoxin:protein disulfide reductase
MSRRNAKPPTRSRFLQTFALSIVIAILASSVLVITGCSAAFPEAAASSGPSVVRTIADGSENAASPGPFQGWALIWTLLSVFVGGLALNLTPCIYPLIPITVSYFGASAGESRGRLFIHGLLYLLGLSVTNATLGVAAALTGGLMGAVLQNPLVLIGVAVVLVFFATSLFGFWELRLPERLTRVASRTHAGYFGSLFMGLTLGVVAAPCLGPFLLGLLTWVAGTGSPWLGFLVFFTLSLGLGIPLVVLGLFSGSLHKLPGSGEWMVWVRKLMGWVMVGMAAYFIRPLLPKTVELLPLACVALAAGLHLGWLDRSPLSFRGFRWLRVGTAVAGLAIAAFLIGSSIATKPTLLWHAYSDTLQKPVILDFTAEWCLPCRKLEKDTFSDPRVIEEAEDHFFMVKVDLTHVADPVNQRLLEEFGVKGVPTIVFLDSQGREVKRLMGFLPPEKFLSFMASARKASPVEQ